MQKSYKYTCYCLLVVALLCGRFLTAYGQYYIRGEVRDQAGAPVQNAKIYQPHTRGIFYTGREGGFGIPSSRPHDSLIFSLKGFDSLQLLVDCRNYQRVELRKLLSASPKNKAGLSSYTVGPKGFVVPAQMYQSESYSTLVENAFSAAGAQYSTSFGMRNDKASYSNIRRFISQGTRVPADAVRVEEIINYFNAAYTPPPAGQTFTVQTQISDCPWNAKNYLLYVALSARKIDFSQAKPCNLVFLIDVSGSMDHPNRLPLLKEAFQLMVDNLRPQDTVSIVTYGGVVGVQLQATGGSEKQKIQAAIVGLEAAGDTPGESALRTAYSVARKSFNPHGNNRIILATDGDFNVGQSSEEELERLIVSQNNQGIYLTCLGVGMGNYKDSKIEILARKGNGNFAYLDNMQEAEKVLITEFTENMYSVAGDVICSISFDSSFTHKYRLIGYDNKRSILDEQVETIEGGEVGSGAGSVVLFEIEPAGRDIFTNSNNPVAEFRIDFLSKDSVLQTTTLPVLDNYRVFDSIAPAWKFVTSLAMFGIHLRNTGNYPPMSLEQIGEMAAASADTSKVLQTQFLDVLDKAADVYQEKKGRRKRKK